MKLDFDPGFDITPLSVDEGFRLGADCFDKGTEFRKLDSVRKSLRDPNCDGPENVYAIMMDVGRKTDLPAMQQRMLLYGVVTYAAGSWAMNLSAVRGIFIRFPRIAGGLRLRSMKFGRAKL